MSQARPQPAHSTRTERGPRTPSDGRVRGTRGIPRARRVPQPSPAPRARGAPSVGDMVAAVESDVALVIAVLRIANRRPRPRRARSRASRRRSRCSRPPASRRSPRAPQGLRLLRAHARLGRRARALPPARRGHAACRRPPGARDRVRGPRRAADLGAAPRHRQARAVHAYPGYPGQVHGEARRPRSAFTASAASSAWTTPWSAACSPAAGACPSGSPPPSSATTRTRPRARRPSIRLADMLAHYATASPWVRRRC